MNDIDYFRGLLGPEDPARDLAPFTPPAAHFAPARKRRTGPASLAPFLVAAIVLTIVAAVPLVSSMDRDRSTAPSALGGEKDIVSVSVMTDTQKSTYQREVDANGKTSVQHDNEPTPTTRGATPAEVDFIGAIPTRNLAVYLTDEKDPSPELLAHRAVTLRLTRHLDAPQLMGLREALRQLAPTAQVTAPDGVTYGIRSVARTGALDGMDLLFDTDGNLVGQRYQNPEAGVVWEVVVDSQRSRS